MPGQQRSANAGSNGASGRSAARSTVLRGLTTLTASAMLVLMCSPSARAGEWVQVSCINPNQTAAGSAGWIAVIAGGGYGSNSDSACGPGSPAVALLSTDAAVAVGSQETLQYMPPPGSTLNGGLLDVGLSADGWGSNVWATAIAYTPEYLYDASNVFFQCAAGVAACSPMGEDFTGQLEIPTGRGGRLYLSAGCAGREEQVCDEGGHEGAWSMVRLWWANMRLANGSTPAGSGVSGTLLNPEARGVKELTLTATDYAGPGVYNVTVQGDGQALYSGTPDSNGGQCAAVGESGASLMFDASQPCKQSESVDASINTVALHDGQHTLQVTVADAAQNASVVYDGRIMTHNAPANTAPPSISDAAALTGSTLSAEKGEWATPSGAGPTSYSYGWQDCDAQGNGCDAIPGAQASSYTPTGNDVGHTLRVLVSAADNDGSSAVQSEASAIVGFPAGGPLAAPVGARPLTAAGAANGNGAIAGAQLHLAGRPGISRAYAHRALTLTGQLINAAQQPIGGATLDVREQAQGSSSAQLITHAVTVANGTFTVHVPAGPSRLVLLDYRAFANDSSYTAQAQVRETVSAGVQLHISPRRTSPAGSITLSGRVQGAVPRAGVVVELLVHYRGAWEPFRDPRTDARGGFHMRYQFQDAIGRFPFRAQVLGGQAGFPYARGQSPTVDVAAG